MVEDEIITKSPSNFQAMATFIRATKNCLTRSWPQLAALLTAYCDAADDAPSLSNSSYNSYVSCLVELVEALPYTLHAALLVLKALKVQSRQPAARQAFGERGMCAVVALLATGPEAQVLRSGGLGPLVRLLQQSGEDVQANAAGAIQSICFQAPGRVSACAAGAVPALVALLGSGHTSVQARVAGALHNLSSDASAIALIRRAGGIPPLVELLGAPAWGVCASAAGALQNLSREIASRQAISSLGAVPSLARLLSCPDAQAQVCAAGALLNIVGPVLEDLPGGPAQRRARPLQRLVLCGAAESEGRGLTEQDLAYLVSAAELADQSAGLTAPHPNSGCVLVAPGGRVLSQTFQRAQGSESAERAAVAAAGSAARGATAYLNLESGDCHGDLDASTGALISAGVARAVVGLRHPLAHLRGAGAAAMQRAGVAVEVLGEAPVLAPPERCDDALGACLRANEALLHRAATGRPFSVLKYAMTADGKIATSAGHAAWVSSPASRQLVFEARARSDAIVVGGNTVRRDNPQLTTRREGGHTPARIVMSRTLDLPQNANLWDVSTAPTIVMTQRGARRAFQDALSALGVEVVQFDFLTPEAVAAYCQERGFLQVLWECGGTLAAPAIASGVIHKALAFIAPKLIGGVRAPSPVGELGNVEMTQALSLADAVWQPVGPDMLLSGYLPASGGLAAVEAALAVGALARGTLDTAHASSSGARSNTVVAAPAATAGAAPAPLRGCNGAAAAGPVAAGVQSRRPWRRRSGEVVEFYKAWDRHGALSNFSPHVVDLPGGPVSACGALSRGAVRAWPSVEHFYQAQKFAGVDDQEAKAAVEAIAAAASPEEAARIGRRVERAQPDLLRADWAAAKLTVMAVALRAKFTRHVGPRRMLLGTAAQLVEASPHDYFWGRGVDGSGANHLGALLMRLRDELAAGEPKSKPYMAPVGFPGGLARAAAAPRKPVAPAAREAAGHARG
ncbi:hypothetical protein WJX81_002479 [Elliptochloris bilobata]|uniref:5-amino-6-(5-phosphoribosylamino)uracil reductase n=1 Tax=Elliptochloris bilobata TaxID=381761 RepID=A0AAW1RTW3_9CHLO